MKKYRQTLLTAAVGAALSAGTVHAGTMSEFCTSIGGTMDGEVCTYPIQGWSNADTIKLTYVHNADTLVEGGSFRIEYELDPSNPGYPANVAAFTLSDNGEHTLTFEGSSVFVENGGGVNSFGIGALAYGETDGQTMREASGNLILRDSELTARGGSIWTLAHRTTGKADLILENSTLNLHARGVGDVPSIYMMVSGQGSAVITVDQLSTLSVEGGIGTMVATDQGLYEPQIAEIRVSGSLNIAGDVFIPGIEVVASGDQAFGSIVIEHGGKGIISSVSGNGIDVLATNGGRGVIEVTGKNSQLQIAGEGDYSILNFVEQNGVGEIRAFNGGHVAFSQISAGYVVQALAYQSESSEEGDVAQGSLIVGSTEIGNDLPGTLEIRKENDGLHVIGALAGNMGGKGKAIALLDNRNGSVILDSSDHNGAAIGVGAQGIGATAVIYNCANCSMTFQGSEIEGYEGYGLGFLAMDGGNGSIRNDGTLNLGKRAINALSDGLEGTTASFTNTGLVNAVPDVIFDSETKTESEKLPVHLLVANDTGMEKREVTLDSYAVDGERTVWTMKDDWVQNSTWVDGGTLNFTNIDANSADAESLLSAFVSAKGEGTTVLFNGEEMSYDGSVGSVKFTAAHAQELIDLSYAGSVVTNITLDESDATGAKQALTVGATGAHTFSDSLGFRSIRGVSSVDVVNGKTLTLIGTASSGAMVESDVPIALDNASIRFGVDDESVAGHQGTVGNVTMKGTSTLGVTNGTYTANMVTGEGTLNVSKTGTLNVMKAEISGDLRNEGCIVAKDLTVNKGTVETSGTIKATGTVKIGANAVITANGLVSADTLDVKGTFIRGQNASIVVGKAAQDLIDKEQGRKTSAKAKAAKASVPPKAKAASVDESKAEASSGEKPKFGLTNPVSSGYETPSLDFPVQEKVRSKPVLPLDAQAFAAFDAVTRIVSDIERGANPDGHGLWVKLQTNESEFDARSGSKFKIDSDGAVVGAEAKLTPAWKVGGAFSYLDGEVDAGSLKNDWTSYGLHGYVHFKEGAFGVKGTAGWLQGTSEAEKDYDADVRHASVRAEYDLPTGPVTFTPFLGARVMSGSFDDMDSQTAFSLPVGVAMSGTLTTGGWTIVPSLEVSYVRSMGDTESEDVRFLPKDAFTGALSLKAEKGAWSGELSMRGAAGSNDYEDRGLMAKVGYTF